jgi:hypothetical protein
LGLTQTHLLKYFVTSSMKFNVMNKNLTHKEMKLFGLDIDEFIVHCTFNLITCNFDDFEW